MKTIVQLLDLNHDNTPPPQTHTQPYIGLLDKRQIYSKT